MFLFCGQDEGNDEPVETQDLSEDQDEDHAHEEPGLLRRASHTCVAHDADGKAGCQSAEAHTQPGAQIEETPAHAEKHFGSARRTSDESRGQKYEKITSRHLYHLCSSKVYPEQ